MIRPKEILQEDYKPSKLIEAIQSSYAGIEICIRFTHEPTPKKSAWQGSDLSPTVLNLHTKKMLREWKLIVKTGIQMTRNTRLNTIFYADGEVFTVKSEDEFQISENHLNKIGNYTM